MKIAIDISQLHHQALKRGVGFYERNLYRALKKLKDENEYFLRKKREADYKADLIHYPYFDPFFLTLPWFPSQPVVVTVHDLIPLKFPSHYPPGMRGKIKWQIQKRILRRVAAIITDSKNSKKDIEEIIHYPPDKIFPIYLAAHKNFRKLEIGNWKLEISKKFSLPENFLLYVGDLNWNKNVEGLIKAFKKLQSESQTLKLILIGPSFKLDELDELDELKNFIIKLNLGKEVKLLGFVPTEDLVAIYNLATLYIQPSFYEGFGLPVLEAMSCGCPVICSHQASLPEVGGKAVAYFSPYKKGDLGKKLVDLLSDKQRLKELSRQGLRQAKKFSWKKTALATKEVYEKILKKD